MPFIKKKTVEPTHKTTGRVILEWVFSIIIALLLATVIRSSVVMAYVIPSGSMLTTLEIGDRVIVNKAAYTLRIPFTHSVILSTGHLARGDVVVFEPPFPSDDPYIKRIIGLPGESIEIINKKVYVNGQPLEEPYTRFVDPNLLPTVANPRDNLGPIRVPEGKLFLMGDNRDSSYDSRFWGFADQSAVLGQAKFHLWSWDSQNHRPRLSRFLTRIH